MVAIVILVVSWFGDTRAQRRARQQKKQMRFDAIHRAGGLDSIHWAAASGGRNANTVGEMNIWLSAMGLDTPVISANAITQAHVEQRRFTTTADVELTNGTTITYRVHGRRSADKLATLIAAPLGDKCTKHRAIPGP